MRVDHLAISVADLEAMTAWYCTHLRARIEYEIDRPAAGVVGVVLDVGRGQRLELLSSVGSPTPVGTAPDGVDGSLRRLGYHHLAIGVDDVPAAFDALVGADAPALLAPAPGSQAGITVAFVTDPEHNIIELISRPAPPAADPPVWVALAATPHSVGFVQVGEWRTRVLQAGPADATPLILMAGTGGHLEAYAHNIAVLADSYRVIAYDYPGHGYTTTATRDLELPDYVEHLRLLFDTLGIERAHLNGESLGGWVAIKFAAQYPERTLRLVLNTPGGTMARPEVMERIRSLSQAAADEPTAERIRARLEWLMADPATVTDELVAIRQAVYSRPGFAESMRHILCLQDPTVRARNLVTDAELAAVPHEALVIWTSNDPSGPAGTGIAMAEKMRQARFEFVPGAGHWPQWEQHDTFNRLVLDFLAQPAAAAYTEQP